MTATTNPVPRRVMRGFLLLTASAATGPASKAASGAFSEVLAMVAVETAAERHDRLTEAAKRAPHGEKLRLAGMVRNAMLQRMAAELAVRRG